MSQVARSKASRGHEPETVNIHIALFIGLHSVTISYSLNVANGRRDRDASFQQWGVLTLPLTHELSPHS